MIQREDISRVAATLSVAQRRALGVHTSANASQRLRSVTVAIVVTLGHDQSESSYVNLLPIVVPAQILAQQPLPDWRKTLMDGLMDRSAFCHS